jgi:flagellar biosynthetic protein FliO
MEWILVKTLFSLLLVLGLMVGVVWLIKKFLYGTKTYRQHGIAIDILGSRMIQPKHSVVVIRVEGRTLVIGVSDAGMTTLTELDANTLPVQGQEDELPELNPADDRTFMDYLKVQAAQMIPGGTLRKRNPSKGRKA